MRKFSFPHPALLFISLLLTPLPSVKAEENLARVYFFHALQSKEEGDFLKAEGLLQKAIELEPENADFHFELGNLYVAEENLQAGRFEFERAVMISPRHVAARYNLGLVYRELKLMAEARDQFRRVLELDPVNLKAELQIGYTYQLEGFVDEAREAFHRAQAMDVTNPEPREALEDLDRFEEEERARSRDALEQSLQERQRSLRSGEF